MAAFGLGLVIGFAMTMLALRFYVSITQPHAVAIAASLAVGALITWLGSRKKRPSVLILILAFVAATPLAIVGTYAAIHGLLAIYPPNFT
ncbi:hypothetical protein ABAC402_14680 [Asticcacaulis sp. AC402]|nr:hypothetical protein ABAC402_14680 [Asticcacaulis sp. AC402]